MKGNKIMELLGKAEIFTRKNSPAILTGLAVVGVLSTAWAAFKAGPKADEILKKYRKDMEDCHPDDKEAKRAVVAETAKKMIPVVAPTVIMGSVTAACMIGSTSVSNRRVAALSAAYTLSETTVKNLNDKMEEMLGEKKARAIKDSIMKDKLKADADKDRGLLSDTNFVFPNNGTVLCKDLYSGRLFHSTAEKIRQAITTCSYNIITDMYISLNEFYDAIDSPELPRIPMGDDFGWNLRDLNNKKLPIILTALLTENDIPCLCIDYTVGLRDDYRNLH